MEFLRFCVTNCFIFRTGVIPVLADILADAQKEKVSRIILAVFRVRKIRQFQFIYKLARNLNLGIF